MQSHATEFFGIETEASWRAWQDGVLTDTQPEVRLSMLENGDADRAAAARDVVRERLERRFGSDAHAIEIRLNAWDRARTRLVQALRPGRELEVHVTDRIADGRNGAGVLYSWSYDPMENEYRVNPVGFMLDQFSSPGAERAFSPVLMFVHETDHKDDCLVGSGCRIGAWEGNIRAREETTVDDIDLVRDALGLPRRQDYPQPSEVAPGGTEAIEGGHRRTRPFTPAQGRGIE